MQLKYIDQTTNISKRFQKVNKIEFVNFNINNKLES
jgi:hypothetical protein